MEFYVFCWTSYIKALLFLCHFTHTHAHAPLKAIERNAIVWIDILRAPVSYYYFFSPLGNEFFLYINTLCRHFSHYATCSCAGIQIRVWMKYLIGHKPLVMLVVLLLMRWAIIKQCTTRINNPGFIISHQSVFGHLSI